MEDARSVPILIDEPSSSHQIAYITLFSMLGVVIRIYSAVASTILPSVIYPQMIGCFIIGYTTKATFLDHHLSIKKGLTVGLSGSITSFSSFIIATWFEFGVSIWSGILIVILTMGLSFGAFQVGEHVAKIPTPETFDRRCSFLDTGKWVYLLTGAGLIGILGWAISDNRLQLPLAMLLGPIGSICRFYLSRLNSSFKGFPLGTYLANISATFLLSILVIVDRDALNHMSCAWLFAWQNGFCGCLSTISSFILELSASETVAAYRYWSASIGTGLLCTLVIIGSFTLSHSISKCII